MFCTLITFTLHVIIPDTSFNHIHDPYTGCCANLLEPGLNCTEKAVTQSCVCYLQGCEATKAVTHVSYLQVCEVAKAVSQLCQLPSTLQSNESGVEGCEATKVVTHVIQH